MTYWADKRVVVTGGSGFLGRFVVENLHSRGCRDAFVPRSKDYDLRDSHAIARMYKNTEPDMVIHLAAVVGGIGANRNHPGTFFYDNLMMGVQLMEYARRFDVPKFVGIGTVCAYPKSTPVPFRESELWSGYPEETNAPYGLAKKMLLVQAQAYRDEFDYNAIHLLPVNLYGPGDNFDEGSSHVIPALIRKFIEAREQNLDHVDVWGDGTPTREFLYVEDAARGIVLAAERYDSSEPVNLGSGKEISVRDLSQKIRNLTGFQGEIRFDVSKPNGQPRRCLDVTKARKAFRFEAEMDLDQGLKSTVEWYLRSNRIVDYRAA
tara:strand:- start:1335 stop:2294 length:960 start_codon:yes stop_codon:yes gene_type:complete